MKGPLELIVDCSQLFSSFDGFILGFKGFIKLTLELFVLFCKLVQVSSKLSDCLMGHFGAVGMAMVMSKRQAIVSTHPNQVKIGLQMLVH